MRLSFVLLIGALCTACSASEPTEVSSQANKSIGVKAGSEFSITLQNIGPGEYEQPPAISSSIVSFSDVSIVSPYVPAGVTQRFRFRALAPGTSIIRFHQNFWDRVVEDTVRIY